ncbi:MAG: hypothetical protein KZQ66_12455 [Candidatus Thiodiazotropha sp. (ex Lucinoma aequizonata)]|nr:hypothetical protein [Candidatus Thiodiazotropha sp. (ex Lucinoma aequizonata)]MCU7889395.1 hypothetical protein [Candidatus Thiodiazotropha sp. (ex Lucinoma aequizonata)]MCU7896041.1 hypothetical protein [Candidatus Thiodiazotropha sp. (ex Lucinoma aequizonata)]MCU7899541.1 hypothetical protein [Candidatus Thiodiazotropha sp. (ex Lucinoma aequizonata)]MCU7902697.1 hypothetical protein [Candidatus Thiodiazotropha sp. (ex Lucinoma aequizonata)]
MNSFEYFLRIAIFSTSVKSIVLNQSVHVYWTTALSVLPELVQERVEIRNLLASLLQQRTQTSLRQYNIDWK